MHLVQNSAILFMIFMGTCRGKIHTLTVVNDERPVIVLSTFGFLEGGHLKVNVTNLKIHQKNIQPAVGFSFDKSSSSGTSSYVEREESNHGCVLETDNHHGDGTFDDVPRAIMKIEMGEDKKYKLTIKTRLLHGLKFYGSEQDMSTGDTVSVDKKTDSTTKTMTKPTSAPSATKPEDSKKDEPAAVPAKPSATPQGDDNKSDVKGKDMAEQPNKIANASDSANTPDSSRRKRAASKDDEKLKAEYEFEEQQSLPLEGNFVDGLNILFYVRIEKKEQIGLYELYFHNCEVPERYNIKPDFEPVTASFSAHITEMNGESFLSAGDMALPLMYGVISLMFFAVGVIWIQVICTTKETVFKIHYLMAVIILVKGMSVMFHSLDYYFIAKDGRTEAWAVIFYIVHLLKGILLIICLLLIGTGWAFIKYILSDRDKRLFMIVIPMQVMVNIAYIIMEETEEGNKSYYTWKNIVILVDILCCGAILVPVVWSIRHLQEASQTDGKAAINLSKLQLFRHFYVLVVCYLYFTRIIVYLLEITLPFQYIWIHALFSELGAFVFFSITGYKFRPGCDNPYLKLDQYDSDEDPEEAITQSGAMENITRVNRKTKEDDETDEFDVLLPKQRTTTKV